jgi:hypothetical protein
MSIVLCIVCHNVGVALGMALSGVLREQRSAHDGLGPRQAEAD